jgi:hypothetical protein
LAPHLLIETAILAALGLVVRITFHGLLHGLLEPTWTAYQVLIAACAVTWLAVNTTGASALICTYRLSPR